MDLPTNGCQHITMLVAVVNARIRESVIHLIQAPALSANFHAWPPCSRLNPSISRATA